MSATRSTLVLGAVAYDPKVVTIWDGFRAFFGRHGLDLDYILYASYERQVEGQFAGHYDVGWHSPLAWLQAERVARARGRRAEAIAMRDSDRDLTSVIVARSGAGEPATVAGLRGRRVAVGAADSPQATLIPLLHLAEAGLVPDVDFTVVPFDLLRGKHGDHIGGERDAARALAAGAVDAACMIDSNLALFAREGVLPAGGTRVLAQTAPYDHCNFTILDDAPQPLIARFRELLLAMSYADPEVRPLLDLEGLKRWLPGRVDGYGQLARAIDRFGTIDSWLAEMASGGGAGISRR